MDETTLQRYHDQGEIEISQERPFLVDRASLSIVAGTGLYQIPDYVLSIRRVTYRGYALNPLTRRNEREVFQSANAQGSPFFYVFNNIGANIIKLFPIPSETISAYVGDMWSGAAISSSVIIEFYRSSDNSSFIIHPSLRRQLLKTYIASQYFLQDTQQQNISIAQYFSRRYEKKKSEYYSLLDELYSKSRRLMIHDFTTSNFYPGSPVLPLRFGVGVDSGE